MKRSTFKNVVFILSKSNVSLFQCCVFSLQHYCCNVSLTVVMSVITVRVFLLFLSLSSLYGVSYYCYQVSNMNVRCFCYHRFRQCCIVSFIIETVFPALPNAAGFVVVSRHHASGCLHCRETRRWARVRVVSELAEPWTQFPLSF